MNADNLKGFPPLSIPSYPLRMQQDEKGALRVFDPLRKKWLVLNPEEYIRQNFTQWLMQDRHYPSSLLQNEVAVDVNGQKKRCDTLAFDRQGLPLLIVEYKAPGVEITQDVFDQIYRYNICLKARYLVVTNGRKIYCCRMDYTHDTYHFIKSIPTFYEAMGLPVDN